MLSNFYMPKLQNYSCIPYKKKILPLTFILKSLKILKVQKLKIRSKITNQTLASNPGLAQLPPFTTTPTVRPQFYDFDNLTELVDEICEKDFRKFSNFNPGKNNDTVRAQRKVRVKIFLQVLQKFKF